MSASPTQLVVLGMHRSGTSSVTRLLNLAGAWFGPDGIATEANEENPRGFWERRDVRAVCDGLLHAGGFDWWKVANFELDAVPMAELRPWLDSFAEIVAGMDEHAPWVVKEPRLCLLLPLLLPLLDAPVCVHVVREPLEISESIRRRNAIPVQAGIALWELYTVRAFEASAGLPRVLIRYEELIDAPMEVTSRLVSELTGLGVRGLGSLSEAEVTAFISGDLRRQRQPASRRRVRLNEVQARLASAIDDGSVLRSADLGPVSAGAIDELRSYETAEDERRTAEDARRTAEATIAGLEARLADAQAERDAMGRYRDTETARRRELGRLADEAIADLERDIARFTGSRIGQVTRRLLAARQLLTPGLVRTTAGPLDPSVSIAKIRREEIRRRAQAAPAPAAAPAPEIRPAEATADRPLIRRVGGSSPRVDRDRPRVAVLAWDVGHNPLGRANVLAEVLARHFDVELWGAQFDRYGTDVWAPLRNARTPINVFPGGTLPGHLRTMQAVAEQIDADAIWVSKPRLPSYALGILAAQARSRPLVLDVDDHELAFFGVDEGRSLREVLALGVDELAQPFEQAWTQACDRYIDAADQVTVSNVALQQRYGGLIVPHARDEEQFDPERFDRAEVRRQLGVGTEQRLLLFGGTPRAHKGVIEVLEALERIGDPRNRLLMFGTREFDDLRPRIGDLARWAIVLPAQSFEDLPGLVVAADLACVIQDPSHPVSRYQMPAKISDALAMGVPCLVTPTPPLQPFIAEGVVSVLQTDEELHDRIRAILDDPDGRRAQAERGRRYFLSHLSYAAVGDAIAPVFERLIADPPSPSPRLGDLASAVEAIGGPHPSGVVRRRRRVPRRRDPDATELAPGTIYDVAMFWKQNDSGIYGRRQDMFLQELVASERVGTIVHFDNPITPELLASSYRAARGSRSDQRRLVATETVARVLHRRDEPGLARRTFVFGSRYSRRLGAARRDAYVTFVGRALTRAGIGQRPLVLWGYPSNDDLPSLIDAIEPDLVVTDVVDDNRTWYEPGAVQEQRIEANYRAVLARSDVVIANCEPVATAMGEFAERVHVVPNGLELPSTSNARVPRSSALQGLTGPVIAYVGNLSDRFDVGLVEAVARARPDWNLVLVGSAHLDRSALALDRLPNVRFPGVMPYRDVQAFLAHVDVAIIPHVDDAMTRSMNPLKAYVYASAGVPIVSTPVSNLPDFGDLLTVAAGPDAFVAAIEARVEAGRPAVDLERLRPHSWERRLAQVFALIDEAALAPTEASRRSIPVHP